MSKECFYIAGKPTRFGNWILQKSYRGIVRNLWSLGIRKILEVGIGRCLIADACKDYNIDYTGIDNEQSIVRLGLRKGHRIIEGTVPPLPYPVYNNKYDAFVCLSVIEHMNTYIEANQLVKEVRDCLIDNGFIVLLAPDIRFCKWFFWDIHPTHNWVTTKARLELLLTEAGFDIVKSCLWLDGFEGFWAYLIWILTKIMPPTKKSWLYKFRKKYPSAFVIGKKNA